MKTCNDWLDAVKKRHKLESDYALAKLLGVQQTNISRYRLGRGSMDVYTAARVAELLNEDALKVIATAEAERARNDEQRTFWKRLAAGVLLVAGVNVTVPPAPAQAAEGPMYIMSNLMQCSFDSTGRPQQRGDIRVPAFQCPCQCSGAGIVLGAWIRLQADQQLDRLDLAAACGHHQRRGAVS